jgi:hypothetical protein
MKASSLSIARRTNESTAEYIVDDILPRYEIHLIAGPSGAGKSTLLLQFIQDWSQGKSFFDHASYPEPFLYVSGDRSADGVRRTLSRVGIDASAFPLFPVIEKTEVEEIENIIELALGRFPSARVLFIEGLGSLVSGGKTNDYSSVAKFLKKLTRMCKKRKLTIIGVIHSAKTKKGEEYSNPREKALGSVAWGAYSETIIYVEPVDPQNPADTLRRVQILPRNAKSESFDMKLDENGRLIPASPKMPPQPLLLSFLAKLGEGKDFTTEEVLKACQGFQTLYLPLAKKARRKGRNWETTTWCVSHQGRRKSWLGQC